MRGGLDDALDKLARRDELRRRAAGEASGQPPAVTELVEAVAAVVARNPELAITMGVEGAGDPVLLHFANEQGVVQVSADNPVTPRVTESAPASHRHADFDIDAVVETVETVDDSFEAQATQRLQDYLTPAAAQSSDDTDIDPFRYDAARQYEATGSYEPSSYDDRYESESTSGKRRRSPYESVNYDGGSYPDSNYSADPYPEHPYAAKPPPPVPPQTPSRPTLTPLPEPIPLRVEPGSSDVAAKRLAALLRENPSLLQQAPPD